MTTEQVDIFFLQALHYDADHELGTLDRLRADSDAQHRSDEGDHKTRTEGVVIS